jgi:putative membrane protein
MIGPDDLPSVNAALNSTAVVLLIGGYLAIRCRRVSLHKTCMLAALVASTAFLASYLYYHSVVRGGHATYFTDRAPDAPNWMNWLYLAVLWTHIPLAAAVVPLALFTAYQAIRGRFARHVRVARWTLPIWLYVSVTGVVVYWMLYRLYPSP